MVNSGTRNEIVAITIQNGYVVGDAEAYKTVLKTSIEKKTRDDRDVCYSRLILLRKSVRRADSMHLSKLPLAQMRNTFL